MDWPPPGTAGILRAGGEPERARPVPGWHGLPGEAGAGLARDAGRAAPEAPPPGTTHAAKKDSFACNPIPE